MKINHFNTRIRVLLSIGVIILFISMSFNSLGQDFTLNSDTDWDAGTKNDFASNSDNYNVTTDALELKFPNADMDSNLVSYWALNQNSATQVDETGNNSGSVTGATYTQFGVFGGAYVFDGAGDYIQVTDDDSLTSNNFTISLWLKGGTTSDAVYYKGSTATNREYSMLIPADSKVDTCVYNLGTSTSLCTGDDVVQVDVWYHYVTTWNGTTHTISLYRNGTFANSNTAAVEVGNYNSDLFIGRYGGAALEFNGSVDEFKFYNRVLSTGEIDRLYNWGKQYVEGFTENYTRTQAANNSYHTFSVRPSAYYNNSVYYFTYLDSADDRIMVKAYQAVSEEWSGEFYVDLVTSDDAHRVSSIGELPNNKLIIFYDAWGSKMRYKISTYTTTQIASNLDLLSDWGTRQEKGTSLTYPQPMSFDDKLVLFYRIGSAASGYWAYDSTTNGTWLGENIFSKFKSDGTYQLYFTKIGNNIYCTGANYTLSTINRKDIYFTYSTDEGTTWLNADGTPLGDYIGNETGKIIEYAYNTSTTSVILDENNYPTILAGHCEACSTTNTLMMVANYSAALGSSGQWNIDNLTDEDGNLVYGNYYGQDIGGFFLNTINTRPTFYSMVNVSGSFRVARFVRQAGEIYQFDRTYYDDTIVLASSTGGFQHVWNMPDDKFEAFTSLSSDGTTYHEFLYGNATIISWTSSAITPGAGERLLNMTITYTNVSATAFIEKIEWLESGTITAYNVTDITSGTSTTFTQSDAALVDVDSAFNVRIYLTSDGDSTPDIVSIYGYYELANTAPTIDNCPTETLLYKEGENIQLEFQFTDNVGDTVTFSSDTPWLEIDPTTGITHGNRYVVDNDQTFTVVITATDTGALTDTCTLTIRIRNEPDPKQPDLKFDFLCYQISYHEMVCKVTNTYGVPKERLNITWHVGEHSSYYYGEEIIHYFPNGFVMGQKEKVTLTIEPLNKTANAISKTQIIESNHIPILWFVVALFIAFVAMLIIALSKDKKKSKKSNTKLIKAGKTIVWASILGLGAILIWYPLGLPTISILGFDLLLIIGVSLILICTIFLIKFIIYKYKNQGRYIVRS